jgi:hypothetical protein
MSPRTVFLATAGLLVAAVAHASDKPAPYQLKQRSAFALPTGTERAPFWPIGWKKRAIGEVTQSAVPTTPKFVLDEKSYKLTSILLGNPSLAIINGRTYMEGEFVRQARPAAAPTVATSTLPANARVRVFRIQDGQVVLQYQNETVTLGLQRPELAQKHGEEELLIEDRP